MDFEKVKEEHIIKGIKDFNEKGMPNGFGPSSTYDLVFEGKSYPPKAVMAYANFNAVGRKIESYFKGGLGTDCFNAYERNNFSVVPKNQKIQTKNVKLEFAEWLLNKAPDSYHYYLGSSINSVIERLDEINNFFSERDLFLVDEKNYRELINYIKFKNSKEQRLKNKEFYEYDRKNSKGIPMAILGKANYTKFLEQKFSGKEVNYWIFQGSPNIYDINSALKDGYLKSFKVAAHKEKIKIGDKVILWQTGDSAGCYALAEVTSEVATFEEEPIEKNYYINSEHSSITERVRIDIEFLLLDHPVLQMDIRGDKAFSAFKAGNQGTNFSATEQEYNAILRLAENSYRSIENKKTTQIAMSKYPLNQILYGPPGTGKTYRTKDIALNILGVNTQDLSREAINDYFTNNVDQGNIVFTTFHQSMSYEDFVEGIKPVVGSEGLTYEVVPGIFKKLCLPVYSALVPGDVFGSRNQYEIFSVTDSILTLKRESGFLPLAMDFVNEIISEFKNGNLSIDDFGSTNRDGLYHKLPTKWDKYLFGYDSIYKGLIKYVTSTEKNKTQAISPKVLIIDEINRGNVSAIFGELITLIEKDKRLGGDEALMVKLPYSKEYFGVPSNLYIIGTMNTADRSVEALDSALRRRFSFIETPPIPEYIKEYGHAHNGFIDEIDLVKLLSTINKRIEKLLDKDHAIGHSYFLKINSIKGLKAVISNKVIPLLQEYFYGDYGKIGLVMGPGFIVSNEEASGDEFFAPFDYEASSLLERKVYTVQNAVYMSNEEFKKALFELLG
ncbi:AAA family ATPase [Maribacter aquivivus]|uniref:AAA family ATPase n=1 Tax=Maribacter aquivivus TaxID=228958 RepID=UPI002492FB4F|nr:AAA family ATPase [Maribacter aquivivus]